MEADERETGKGRGTCAAVTLAFKTKMSVVWFWIPKYASAVVNYGDQRRKKICSVHSRFMRKGEGEADIAVG